MDVQRRITVVLPDGFADRVIEYDLVNGATSQSLLCAVHDQLGLDDPILRINRNYSQSFDQLKRGDHVRLDFVCAGLLGGKGGFGAGLRAMGKTAAAKQNKPSSDYSLCRDLQGRRLGASNTALLIEKAKKEGHVEADGWELDRPSWVETKRVNSHNKHLAKGDGEHKKHSSSGDGAGSKNEKFAADLARELNSNEETVANSVAAGLERRKKAKIDEEVPLSLVEAHISNKTLMLGSGWTLIAGQVSVERLGGSPEDFIVKGESEFSTIAFDKEVRAFEAKSASEGLVQVGFVSKGALRDDMEANLDGVGDVEGSVSFDMVRRLIWRNGHAVGDLLERIENTRAVKCILESDLSKAVFSIDDQDILVELGFDGRDVIPAVSLEAGESVRITIGDYALIGNIANQSNQGSAKAEEVTLESLITMGADTLKAELKTLGLKFGGSVLERARRLLIAKTLPKEDWPPSIFPS